MSDPTDGLMADYTSAIRECLEGIAEHACTSTGMVCSETDLARHAWCHPCLANDALEAAAAGAERDPRAKLKRSAGESSSARTEGADNQCPGPSSLSGVRVAAEASKLGNTARKVETGRSGSSASIDRRRLREEAKEAMRSIVQVGPKSWDQGLAREHELWVDLGHEIANPQEPLGAEQLRAEVRRKVDRWRAIAVAHGSNVMDDVAAIAEMDRQQLDAMEATVEQTIRRSARGPVRPKPTRWRVQVGQDPAQPMGVTLEQWCQLDNLEGSGRAGRPWGWRAQMVYRSAREAQVALRGMASAKVRAAKGELEQAQQAHELAERLPDAASGVAIELAPMSTSVLGLTNGDNNA